ncbi:MAG: type II toxin-antitoxin system VapC family toxin [Vicinamibacterales bacterium]
MIHLDTSFLIRALVPDSREDAQLRDWLTTETPLAISAVAWAEFLCGPLSAQDLSLAAAVVGEAVPLTADHAVRAAELYNAAGRKRGTFVDCLIAAVAVEEEAVLATANPKDFNGMAGLRLAPA